MGEKHVFGVDRVNTTNRGLKKRRWMKRESDSKQMKRRVMGIIRKARQLVTNLHIK